MSALAKVVSAIPIFLIITTLYRDFVPVFYLKPAAQVYRGNAFHHIRIMACSLRHHNGSCHAINPCSVAFNAAKSPALGGKSVDVDNLEALQKTHAPFRINLDV